MGQPPWAEPTHRGRSGSSRRNRGAVEQAVFVWELRSNPDWIAGCGKLDSTSLLAPAKAGSEEKKELIGTTEVVP